MRSCRRDLGGSYLAAHRQQLLRFEECQGRCRLRPSFIADLVANVTAATAVAMAIIDRTFAAIGGIDDFVNS